VRYRQSCSEPIRQPPASRVEKCSMKELGSCDGPNSVLLVGVGARVDFGLEAVAFIQVEQPDRAQHRNRF
jgi:hypothetical protein